MRRVTCMLASVIGGGAMTCSAFSHPHRPRTQLPKRFIHDATLSKLDLDSSLEDCEGHMANDAFHVSSAPPPAGVVRPKCVEDVQELVRLCGIHGVALIAMGSATSLEGHVDVVEEPAVVVVFDDMAEILQINPFDVVVQPGISYNELNQELKKHGRFFPANPGPGASIGGMIASNCSGENAVKYGTMKELTLSLKVVTADGKVVTTGHRAPKSSAGFDLTHLFISSEGQLGVVVEATLRTYPLPDPAERVVVVVQFPDYVACGTAIRSVIDSVEVAKCELMGPGVIKSAISSAGEFSGRFKMQPTLIVELTSRGEVGIARLREIAAEQGATLVEVSSDEEEMDLMWRLRKNGVWAVRDLRPGASLQITDTCVPVENLTTFLELTSADVESSGLLAPIWGHAGDGNVHLAILFDQEDADEVSRLEAFNDRLVRRALDLDGTCTGEHGVGSGKRKFLEEEFGPEAVDLMRKIKEVMDPLNIMNPGKQVSPIVNKV